MRGELKPPVGPLLVLLLNACFLLHTTHGLTPTSKHQRCPLVFTGPSCNKPVELPVCAGGTPYDGKWLTLDENYFKDNKAALNNKVKSEGTLPPSQVFGNLSLPIPSCALVSSGDFLLHKDFGKAIDKHDLVLRLNNAPTQGYEKDVGSFTSLRYTNMRYSGWRENEEDSAAEPVIGKWCKGCTMSDKASCKKCGNDKDLLYMLHNKVHPLNPWFHAHISSFWERKGLHASSGLISALLLMHVCERVDLYGFHAGGLLRWYYPKYNGKTKGKPPSSKLPEKMLHMDHERNAGWSFVQLHDDNHGKHTKLKDANVSTEKEKEEKRDGSENTEKKKKYGTYSRRRRVVKEKEKEKGREDEAA
eukprot:CAMPEP_0197844558 /NCGR_PEP_ID=MMETSP1438-20131217/1541_1 /TAXON_ID=1461541 /ORGANISM="Pterosperma sp., Strain CCMP1384" /LENGTH=359 /DNA_ID=CAMNT_0043455397 /DNA_START=117 /DNA_END=1193 /DNA_ORIENTATION=+